MGKNPMCAYPEDYPSEEAYALERLQVMLEMKALAEEGLRRRPGPLAELVLQTAEHHVQRCREKYRILT